MTADLDSLQGRFQFDGQGLSYKPRYNVAPTQPVLAVTGNGDRRGELMRWGLIPNWARDTAVGSRMINARAETLGERPAFRRPLRDRRCLVLADGFYEWMAQAGRKKTPMYVSLKSRQPFAMAGLWDEWRSPEGATVRSCTIITIRANSLLQPIHHRMPVVLLPDLEGVWLDPSVEEPRLLGEVLRPYPAEEMDAYPVSALVNSPENDRPECTAPVTGEQEGLL